MDVTTLVSPGRPVGVQALTCERLSLAPGEISSSLRTDTEEQVCYAAAGYGVVTIAGGGGQWPYVLEQGTAFWLGRAIDWSVACSGESSLIVARFRYAERSSPRVVGLPRRIVQPRDICPEIELGRRVRVLFRGPAVGSGTMVTVEESTYSGGGESPVHAAEGMEEVFYFFRGRGRVRLGDEWLRVGAGDAVAVPSGIVHNVRADEGQVLGHVTCNILL